MKIRSISSSCPLTLVRFRAWSALVCALAIGVGCSSDEPAFELQAAPSSPGSPSVFVADPGGAPAPAGEDVSEPPPVAVPLSAPPAEEEPDATETNFLTPPCGKHGADAIADAGVSDAGAAAADAGVTGDAGAPPDSFDLDRCGAP